MGESSPATPTPLPTSTTAAQPTTANVSDWQALANRIENAIQQAYTLRIITIVGPLTSVQNTGKVNEIDSDWSKDQAVAKTTINLLDGDITTQFDEKFIKDPAYQSLRDFHAAREEQGHKIVMDNLAALEQFLKLVVSRIT